MKIPYLIKNYRWTLSYILVIVFINSLFMLVPPIHILNSTITTADIFVGGIYVMRDFAQREMGHRVIIAMIIGALLSYWLADKTVAIASMSAFLVAETIDWGVFTFTRRPLSKRIVLSSSISAPIDSIVFLALMNMLNMADIMAMTLAKFAGIAVLVKIWQTRNRALQQQYPSATPLPQA